MSIEEVGIRKTWIRGRKVRIKVMVIYPVELEMDVKKILEFLYKGRSSGLDKGGYNEK